MAEVEPVEEEEPTKVAAAAAAAASSSLFSNVLLMGDVDNSNMGERPNFPRRVRGVLAPRRAMLVVSSCVGLLGLLLALSPPESPRVIAIIELSSKSSLNLVGDSAGDLAGDLTGDLSGDLGESSRKSTPTSRGVVVVIRAGVSFKKPLPF